jgi:hypothetical protein
MVSCLKESERKPVMYGCNFGFRFMDAIWSHPENMGFEIDDSWIFMLNTNVPASYQLNGCYRSMELI